MKSALGRVWRVLAPESFVPTHGPFAAFDSNFWHFFSWKDDLSTAVRNKKPSSYLDNCIGIDNMPIYCEDAVSVPHGKC